MPNKSKAEVWRAVWRKWVVTSPHLSPSAFKHLRAALATNDPRLLTGESYQPRCIFCTKTDPVKRACPLCLMLWYERECDTVGEIEASFEAFLEDISDRSGSKLTITPLLDFIDMQPWDTVRRELIAEIDLLTPAKEIP